MEAAVGPGIVGYEADGDFIPGKGADELLPVICILTKGLI